MTVQQPRHSEPSANNELGDLLRGMLFGCQVRSENTQLIDGQPSLQLDNLITAPDQAPVVVEAEYEALGTGEADALGRLGLPVVNETHSIEAAIALRYPDSVRRKLKMGKAVRPWEGWFHTMVVLAAGGSTRSWPTLPYHQLKPAIGRRPGHCAIRIRQSALPPRAAAPGYPPRCGVCGPSPSDD